MANIGYARVDPALEEDTQEQLDALRGAGCERIFDDHATGDIGDRPQLASALRFLRPEDTFIVWKLDRLAGSLHQLIDLVVELEERRVAFCSLMDGIDTNQPDGRMVFPVFRALSRFRFGQVRERSWPVLGGQLHQSAGSPRSGGGAEPE
jgi:DNA invertase Pin-like site-specific DNA recombinase